MFSVEHFFADNKKATPVSFGLMERLFFEKIKGRINYYVPNRTITEFARLTGCNVTTLSCGQESFWEKGRKGCAFVGGTAEDHENYNCTSLTPHILLAKKLLSEV